MIIPRPQNMRLFDKKIKVEGLNFCGNNADFAERYLAHFLPIFTERSSENVNVMLKCESGFLAGGYKLITGSPTEIYFSEKEGLRNALSSLVQLIVKMEDGYYITKAETEDLPSCRYRSVMIDLARGLPPIVRLKEDLKRLALAKCNNVHFHLMDEMGICFESDVYKGTENIRGTKPYTKEEMRDIVEFCHTLGIKVLPEIEIPAHASFLLNIRPELKCKTDIENQSVWTVCAGSDKTYEFYDALIAEIVSIFPYEYIHIGGDELYFGDFPEWNNFCHWEECSVCRAVMEKNAMRDKWDMYNYMVTKMHGIVKKHGKKMMMWNDQIDLNRPIAVPRDIVMEFWRVSDKNRGPREGCTYERLTENFSVINAYYFTNYIDCENYANLEKASTYNYLEYPKTKHTENVKGGEICAWEYGNPAVDHYALSFACSTAVILDKLWNTADVLYTADYRRALTRLVLGCDTPDNYDMTELFGSVIPPRTSGKKTYLDKGAEPDAEFYPRHIKALLQIKNTYSPEYLKKLTESIGEQ